MIENVNIFFRDETAGNGLISHDKQIPLKMSQPDASSIGLDLVYYRPDACQLLRRCYKADCIPGRDDEGQEPH